jgi:hypothetical protein
MIGGGYEGMGNPGGPGACAGENPASRQGGRGSGHGAWWIHRRAIVAGDLARAVERGRGAADREDRQDRREVRRAGAGLEGSGAAARGDEETRCGKSLGLPRDEAARILEAS